MATTEYEDHFARVPTGDHTLSREMFLHGARHEAIKQYGFAIITHRLVKRMLELAEGEHFVEAGAGGGYWSYCLREEGAEVVATDAVVGSNNGYGFKPWVPIEQCTATGAVRRYAGRHLMLSWPNDFDRARGWSDYALDAFRGRLLFYIGEGTGGCTGSRRFHKLLADPSRFRLVEHIDIPSWRGIHDRCHVYERVPT